ncbi:anti-sigma factor [Streptomyces sp. TRM70350]|uniref:anti-sigma factor family protein n=1 Tax=Streptomyces sp. TRM70350 TaxID=2856165 RepID=UPI001C454B3D|nr:zf-HC2 domain-containing protein [Streptomyces sp. TRM70350]MBV7697379.1 zf-HC2 domain-containing protein [Streptomyces sp. TRM70350]
MSCMQVARVLQSYLDGETDEITARRVAAHLEDCRRCGLEVAVYREIKQSLARHEAPADEAVARLRAFGETLLHPDRGDDADSGAQPPTSA